MTDFYRLKSLAPTRNDITVDAIQQWLILTTRERLRQAINREWTQLHGKQFAVTPQLRAMTLDSWIRELWKRHRRQYGGPAILSPLAQRLLWRQVIDRWNRNQQQLLPVTTLSELARIAYRQCLLFGVTLDNPQFTDSEDTHAFQQWGLHFQKSMTAINGITLEEAAQQLIVLLQENPMRLATLETAQLRTVEKNIHPLYHELLACFPSTTHMEPDFHANALAFQVTPANRQEECLTVARWIRKHLQEYPTARIAVVTTNPAAYETDLRRALAQVLAPVQLGLGTKTRPLLHIGLPTPLTQNPCFKTALDLLHWNHCAIDTKTLYRVLEDGCWGPADGAAQALLQYQLRQRKLPTITPQRLLSIAQYCANYYLDNSGTLRLYQNIANFMALRQATSKNTLNSWAKCFQAQLQALSWQGGEIKDAVIAIFQEFIRDSRKFSRWSLAEALSILANQAAHTPQPTYSGIVNLLGPQEAAREPFDVIWLLDATDVQWPPAPAPHPLLPIRLQINHQMPHCNAAQELAVAQRTLNELRGSARIFIASTPQNDDDKKCTPWAPIAALPALPMTDKTPDLWTQWLQAAYTPLECWEPGNAPPVEKTETLSGGVNIFKSQLECPFSAFTRHRLHAQPLENAPLGLDASDWGKYLHYTLKQFWQETETQEKLRCLNNNKREAILKIILHDSFDVVLGERVDTIGPQLRFLEEQRALQLLLRWLTIEDERSPFAVKHTEEKREVTFRNLSLTVRLDRIDTLSNGRQAIIDYKTGARLSAKVWEEPLSEPQLPLYALLDAQAEAIAFANLHHDYIGYVAIGDNMLAPQGKANNMPWANRKLYWRQTLEQLADDFMTGYATPTGNDKVYRQHSLRLLARHGFHR